MDFNAYIERQKRIIRGRHTGETFLVSGGEYIPVGDRERLLGELDSLKGLNLAERAAVRRASGKIRIKAV